MPTDSIAPEMEQYVSGLLASGAYRSREELFTAALRSLRQRNKQSQKRAALIADLEEGLRSLHAGTRIETSAAEILATVRAESSR